MNRNMTEIGSATLPPERQRETAHRYILNLYRMMENITTSFPQVLFESCSGGGGRFDPGIFYYMPQTWTSDNTDAIARLKIQYGTGIVYPAIMMCSHVSAVPNHQIQRITPLDIRGYAASSGNLGYEFDLSQLSPEELESLKQQVAFYKQIRSLVQFGDLYRLLSPFEGNEVSWMYVSEDKTEAVVFYFKVLAEANPPLRLLRLKGLAEQLNYQILDTDQVLGGDVLMNAGVQIPEKIMVGDFQSVCWRLRTV
jgi:alpha-galactosidase